MWRPAISTGPALSPRRWGMRSFAYRAEQRLGTALSPMHCFTRANTRGQVKSTGANVLAFGNFSGFEQTGPVPRCLSKERGRVAASCPSFAGLHALSGVADVVGLDALLGRRRRGLGACRLRRLSRSVLRRLRIRPRVLWAARDGQHLYRRRLARRLGPPPLALTAQVNASARRRERDASVSPRRAA